ncbi:MAG TPA: RNA ligase family protein, partial [Herpetosiphonaceae bacterium]|nr:RNA ligase family protein [Herpetosiphonaceae bacterium]
MEFDVLDRESGQFLSTELRQLMFAGLPIASVPVLHAGPLDSLEDLLALIGPSAFKTESWRDRLAAVSLAAGLDPARVAGETDRSDLMEGLYIKVETADQVLDRYKYVRGDFLQAILDSGSHWLDRPIVPNQLRDGVDLYGASYEPV